MSHAGRRRRYKLRRTVHVVPTSADILLDIDIPECYTQAQASFFQVAGGATSSQAFHGSASSQILGGAPMVPNRKSMESRWRSDTCKAGFMLAAVLAVLLISLPLRGQLNTGRVSGAVT